MSKYLKKYNEATGEWEIVSAPDVSVVQLLEDGSEITDTNVIVTNYKYTEESGTTTLDETLSSISDDISKLQRNVSWLAEHGGGGSGGGGSQTASYGISVSSPVISNGSAYIASDKLTVEFMITGGTEGDNCLYAYQFDASALTDYMEVAVNKPVTLTFDISNSPLDRHSMIIRAINPYGINISPVSFNIFKSTLSLIFDKDTAGDNYKDGVFSIMQNVNRADIPLLMTNGLEKAKVVITASCNTQITDLTIENAPAGTSKKTINFWNLVGKGSVFPGNYYVVTFNAEATLGNNTARAEEFTVRIKIINPNELSINLGINGIDTDETVNVPLSSTMKYSFKAYAPNTISHVYYSAKIVNNDQSYLILGQYYDAQTSVAGKNYTDNPSVAVEETVAASYALNEIDFHENDNIRLYIKVWDTNGTKEKEIYKDILITEASNDIFPRQIQTRSGELGEGDTLFASWNKANASAVHRNNWTSVIKNYSFLSSELAETENSSVTVDIQVLNANDASGIHTGDGVPYLRLQNHAYAKADFTYYQKEIVQITNSRSSDNQGFTISLGINADNHTDTKHTLFLWGENNADGNLSKGIRIDVNKIYWTIIEETSGGNRMTHSLSCNFACNERNSVDFSFTKGTSSTNGTARIYVNGVLNAAIDLYRIANDYILPNTAYFGANNVNNTISNYSDVNFYEFSIYTRTLNDMQIVVNGKNSRLLDVSSEPSVIAEYNEWKTKNFIVAKEDDKAIPESVFFENGNYKEEFLVTAVENIAQQSNIPTLYISFPQSSNFNSSYFYSKQTEEATSRKFEGNASYYDPSTKKFVNNMAVKVSLQGTSTLGYRIKNLEMYMAETVTIKGTEVTKLFQPKKEWMPESQFTLKADVVDSAHANNAVLGQWINESGILQNNPAMAAFNENTRPKDVDDNGVEHTHIDSHGNEINYDEDVTIKHTLEGFPILLFIQFSDKSYFQFIGIYSFNLGRYSYYNMGMKFLKNFSRRENGEKVACPKLINYYEEKESMGEVNTQNVFSFEFGNAGNLKVAKYPVWSQYDKSVIQTYGEFKYPGDVEKGDTIWEKLCQLFEATAKFKIDSYYGDIINIFDGIYKWVVNSSGEYQQESTEPIEQRADYYTDIINHLNIDNAAAYFIISNAFGMTDSLGKNMTLRTWDGGETWWTCFYDMDTALGLSNDGAEDNPVTVLIDKVYMYSDESSEQPTTVTGTTYHDDDSKYAAVLSKLWGILRCNNFLYNAGKTASPYYEEIWNNLRREGGKLAKSSNFTNIMAERIGQCGELIYDYDYNSKYIQDTAEQEEGASAAITFLHGTRINFVKDWLTKHFYFLDGIFDSNRLPSGFSYEDSPYNSDIFTISCSYSNLIQTLRFVTQVTTPTFIGITIGNDAYKKYYIGSENTDTVLYLPNGTSSNAQMTIKGASLLSEFNGLQNGWMSISLTNENGVVHSLNSFDVSSSNKVSESPIGNAINAFLLSNKSSLESINLSNTRGTSTLSNYTVNLEKFDKLLNVNISNSDVTGLVLPKTSLQTLNVTNSNITELALENQNIISTIDITGCNRLTSISLTNCNAIEELEIVGKPNLGGISLSNCSALRKVKISDNPALTRITIANCHEIKELVIENCINPSLQISVIDDNSALEKIVLSGLTDMTSIITMPNSDALSNVTALTIINCYHLKGMKFNDKEIEYYPDEDGDPVFDLSAFTSLRGNNLVLRNLLDIKYIRVPNDNGTEPYEPMSVNNSSFYGCNSLTKIFGYIGIESYYAFNGLSNFYVNHSNYVPEDGEPRFVYLSENRFYTNVKILTTDLSFCFAGTNCDIHDAYYILQLCDEDTQNLNNTFSGCRNIETTRENPLSDLTFSKCTSVNNIDGVFGNGCNIGGALGEGLLSPLMNNLTSFKNVFSGNYIIQSNTAIFPAGNIIEEIDGFNPVPSGSWFKDIDLLKNLSSLISIKNSFNNCAIDFNAGQYDATELLKDTVNLLSIENSFNEVRGNGSLGNIFGGNSDDPDSYPRQLKSVIHSFNFTANSTREFKLYKEDKQNKVAMPLGNSLLRRIANSIEYITGIYPGENRTYNTELINYSSSFGGPGILKYIDNFDFYCRGSEIHYSDCNGKDFPYEILKGCTKLKEFPSLFEKVHNFKNNELGSGSVIPIDIDLLYDEDGNSIFKDCVSLENISHGFANISNNITFSLSSDAFKNCNIINADYLFSKNMEDSQYDSTIKGQIPIRLLYQEAEHEYANAVGLTAAQATALGISGDSGIADITGTTEFSGTCKIAKTVIKTMERVLTGLNSNGLEPYTANISSWEGLVVDNPDYNPIMYLVSGNNYSLNPAYNPYKKLWNKYVFDNSKEFYKYIDTGETEYTGIFEVTDEYGNPIVNPLEMPEIFKKENAPISQPGLLNTGDTGNDDYYASITPQDMDKFFGKTNYFCPGDIFKYCVNAATTNIAYAFDNASGKYYGPEIGIRGLRGTIPSFLFEPLNKILSLDGIFSECKSLFPYRWKIMNEGALISGITYPVELFSGLTSLSSITDIFKGTRVWGNTIIPENLFTSNSLALAYAHGLWNGAMWLERTSTDSQIPSSLFASCVNLKDISNMLSNSDNYSIYRITKIVSFANNPVLANCTEFIYRAYETYGEVPEFWIWPVLTLYDYHHALAMTSETTMAQRITNYNKDNFERFVRND